MCHTFPDLCLPLLSAQVSSNGRDSHRTFLRIDGVTETVGPGAGREILPQPRIPSQPGMEDCGGEEGTFLVPTS